MKVIISGQHPFTVNCEPTDTLKKFNEEAFKAYDSEHPDEYASAEYFSKAMKFKYAGKELSIVINDNKTFLSTFGINKASEIRAEKIKLMPTVQTENDKIVKERKLLREQEQSKSLEEEKSKKYDEQMKAMLERNKTYAFELPEKKPETSFWNKFSNLFKPASKKTPGSNTPNKRNSK